MSLFLPREAIPDYGELVVTLNHKITLLRAVRGDTFYEIPAILGEGRQVLKEDSLDLLEDILLFFPDMSLADPALNATAQQRILNLL